MLQRTLVILALSVNRACGSTLRICLDRITRYGPRADMFSELVLDNTRGQQCHPLVTHPNAASLDGRAVDGKAGPSLYRQGGVYSYHVACADSTSPTSASMENCEQLSPAASCRKDGCWYTSECAAGACSYESACNPTRSHCYSMPERDRVSAQPLWCCDFQQDTVTQAQHARIQLWDEAKLGDDRLGNATLRIEPLIASVRRTGSFSATLRLELTPVNESGTISVWAGYVSSLPSPTKHSRSTKAQISYWGAYGPKDIGMLSIRRQNMGATAVAAAETNTAPRHRRWTTRQVAGSRMREWQIWQRLPVLGGDEQHPHLYLKRRGALSAAAASSPEFGLGGTGVCVVSTATGARYNGSQPLGAALLKNKMEFCRACGYRCLLSTGGEHSTSRPAKWDKILALHDALRSCNTVLHVDADVVFRRSFQLPPIAQTWLSATRDFDGLNSGVLLVKRSKQARSWLHSAWQQVSFNQSFSAEQNALRLALRRPYRASSRSRIGLVTILATLVQYPFYGSPVLSKLGRDLNFSAPLFHAAGCAANKGRTESGVCDQILRSQIPSNMDACTSIEHQYSTNARALLQHLQESGSTTLGRRWMKGRDLRIKYTDQKGSTKDGWWQNHPGCSEVGCDDPDARLRDSRANLKPREVVLFNGRSTGQEAIPSRVQGRMRKKPSKHSPGKATRLGT